jgi:hypothetical protein
MGLVGCFLGCWFGWFVWFLDWLFSCFGCCVFVLVRVAWVAVCFLGVVFWFIGYGDVVWGDA